MSDSDDSAPLDSSSVLQGVPIVFGTGSLVKRLMTRIKQQGLLRLSTTHQEQNGSSENQHVTDDDADEENTKKIIKQEVESDIEEEQIVNKTPVKKKSKLRQKKEVSAPKRKRGRPKKKVLDELSDLSDETETVERAKEEGFKYKCELCEEGFNGSIPLAKHCRKVHFVEKPFECSQCGKTFAQIRTLREHRQVNHTAGSANICHTCGKSFSSPTYLKVHQRVHTGERPFSCDQCPLTFKDGSTLRNHYKVKHANVAGTGEQYVCDICGKSFTLLRYLRNHKRNHEPGKNEQCMECGKMFRLKQTLHEHMEMHMTREYQCEICAKTFTHNRSYRRHVKAHAVTQPFHCPMCDRRYKNKKSAEPHMKECMKRHPLETEVNQHPKRTVNSALSRIVDNRRDSVSMKCEIDKGRKSSAGFDIEIDLQDSFAEKNEQVYSAGAGFRTHGHSHSSGPANPNKVARQPVSNTDSFRQSAFSAQDSCTSRVVVDVHPTPVLYETVHTVCGDEQPYWELELQ